MMIGSKKKNRAHDIHDAVCSGAGSVEGSCWMTLDSVEVLSCTTYLRVERDVLGRNEEWDCDTSKREQSKLRVEDPAFVGVKGFQREGRQRVKIAVHIYNPCGEQKADKMSIYDFCNFCTCTHSDESQS